MRQIFLTTVFAGALVLAAEATALAADVCLNVGGFIYVGKSVKVPAKGKCSTWKGFMVSGGYCNGSSGYSSGTLCTSSDDTHTDISLVTTCMAGFLPNNLVLTEHITLPRPALTGGSSREVALDAGTSPGANSSYMASIVDCETAAGAKSPSIP